MGIIGLYDPVMKWYQNVNIDLCDTPLEARRALSIRQALMTQPMGRGGGEGLGV